MRIALFQGPEQPGTVAGNLERLRQAAGAAAVRGARLLVCPEMFLTGYAIGPEATRAGSPSRSTARRPAGGRDRPRERAGPALRLSRARRGRARLQRRPAGRSRRPPARQPPQVPPLRRSRPQPPSRAGDGPPTLAELDGLRLGILICYDVEFPENVRLLALAGADLVAVPTALMVPYAFVAATAWSPTRAYENQVFLAYVNRCGREGELGYYGAILHRRPRRLRPRPRRHRRGADHGRSRSRAACATPAAQHLPRATAGRSSTAWPCADRRGSQPMTASHDPITARRPTPRGRSPISARISRSPTTTGSRTRPASAPAGRAARHRGRDHRRRRWPASSPPTS